MLPTKLTFKKNFKNYFTRSKKATGPTASSFDGEVSGNMADKAEGEGSAHTNSVSVDKDSLARSGQSAANTPTHAGIEDGNQAAQTTSETIPESERSNQAPGQPTASSTVAMDANTPASGDSELRNVESRLMAVLSKLSDKVDNINTTTEAMRRDFDTRLREMGAGLKDNAEKVAAVEQSISFAHDSLGEQKDKIDTLEKDVTKMDLKLWAAEGNNRELRKELDEVKNQMAEKFNDTERRSREYSIRVRGVPAAQLVGTTDHRKPVAAILVKNKLVRTATEEDVIRAMEIAHPLGKPVDGKCNIIARFYARPFRNAVVRAAKNRDDPLEGADRVTEDLTKLDMDRKRRAFPQMQAAYDAGEKVKFQKGQLIINGKTVAIKD